MDQQKILRMALTVAVGLVFHMPSSASAGPWDEYVDDWRDAHQHYWRYRYDYDQEEEFHDYDGYRDRYFHDPGDTLHDYGEDDQYDSWSGLTVRQRRLAQPYDPDFDVGSYYRYGPEVYPKYPTYTDVYQDDDGFRDDAARQMDGHRRWSTARYPRTMRWGIGTQMGYSEPRKAAWD